MPLILLLLLAGALVFVSILSPGLLVLLGLFLTIGRLVRRPGKLGRRRKRDRAEGEPARPQGRPPSLTPPRPP